MKKAICSLLALVMLLCSFATIYAHAEAETRSVFFNASLSYGLSEFYKESFDVYLKNCETEEELVLTVKAKSDSAKYIDFQMGEYYVEKVTLSGEPLVEFEFYADPLEVNDSEEEILYNLTISRMVQTEEALELLNNKKQKEDQNLKIVGCLMLWLAFCIISLVYFIRAKFTKKEMKEEFLKAKGKFVGHICIGLLSGALGYFIFKDSPLPWLGAVSGFGVPFGVVAFLMFYHPSANDDRYYDEDRDKGSASAVMLVLVFLVSFIVGFIAAPIVVIRDIINIIKTYIAYVKARKEKKRAKNSIY